MKHGIQLFLSLTLFVWSTSCIDEIQLTAPSGDFNSNLVLNGKMTHQDGSVLVTVQARRVIPRATFARTEWEAMARVTLFDEAGNQRNVPVMDGRQEATLAIPPGDPFVVQPGKSYTLEVELEDGRVYRSSLQPLIEVPPIEEIGFEQRTELITNPQGNIAEQEIIAFQVTTDPARPDGQITTGLRWETEVIFQLSQAPESGGGVVCYLELYPRLNDFPLFDGTSLTESPGPLQFDIYRTTPNYFFAEGYLIRVYQETLSAEAYAYWEQVRRVLNRSGTIAEDPVGEVQGNWTAVDDPEETVYGLFYTVDRTMEDLFVTPEEVGNPAFHCPQESDGVNLCTDCREAWGADRSSFTPPIGWGG